MALKHIYFVRHGESEYNTSGIILHHDTDLTSNGIRQAESCAARCRNFSFGTIISGPYARAQKTAEIINTGSHREIHTSDLFTEYRYPVGVLGVKKTPALWRLLTEAKGVSSGEKYLTI
ncbi:MAG: histidine phosphatase family protein [Patescibacteria group bacterium]